MSQFYQGVTSGALPPSVPTSFVTNSGTATPAANVLNVVGNGVAGSGTSTAGNVFITGAGNTVTVNETQAQYLTNYRQTGISTAVLSTDYLIGCTASNITITLEAAPTALRILIIKDQSGTATATPITISGNGKNINGSATLSLDQSYASFNLYYNGTNWFSY